MDRADDDELIYRRHSDGMLIDEIAYQFSGNGSGETEKFQLRDGYFCYSLTVNRYEATDAYSLWLKKTHSNGLVSKFSLSESLNWRGPSSSAAGESSTSSCRVIYDVRVRNGPKISRSGYPNDPNGHIRGTYSLEVQIKPRDSSSPWRVSVCTGETREKASAACPHGR